MVFLEIRYTVGMEINDLNPVEMPSNQKFGWLFSLIFSLAALYFLKNDLPVLMALSISLAIIFALVTIARPSTLAPFNRVWFKLSIALGNLMSPIILGLIFFVVISPVALISGFFGRDELLMKKRLAASYWIDKEPIEPQSFKDQY